MTTRRVVRVHGVPVVTRGAQCGSNPRPDPQAYSDALARRREAAWRSEPLQGMPAVRGVVAGDPMVADLAHDGPPAVLADVLIVEVISEHTAALLGIPAQRARAICEALAVKCQWSPDRRCYLIRAQDLDRVVPVLEARGAAAVVRSAVA